MANNGSNRKNTEKAKKEGLVWARLRKKNIPAVNLDARWLKLFQDKDKTPEIRRLEHELKELMKRQGRVTNDIKDIKKLKEKLMQDVLDTMEDTSLSEEKRRKKQDAHQRLILEAKDKIEQLEDEQVTLPGRIREANNALIVESVKVCFEEIDKNKHDIELLGGWIEETRAKLKKRILLKQDKETRNEEIYTYLHDLLGPEVMEAFDEEGS